MQTGINQTGHFVKKDIIMRAYSQLREFLCPKVFPVLPDAKSKQGRRKKTIERNTLATLYTAENQVLVLVFKYYMFRGE